MSDEQRTFNDLTLAEKIVWIFQQRITEGHREAIEGALGIDQEQYSDAIRSARDEGLTGIDPITQDFALDKRDKSGNTILGPIYLTQIYERKGWWTCRPTERIVAIAVQAGRSRNLSEAKREARLYGSAFGTNIGYAVTAGEAGLAGSLSLIEGVPELRIDPRNDYVLAAIDKQTKKISQARLVAR